MAYLSTLNDDLGDVFVFDPFIMRGLDYYTGTVFENLVQEEISLGSLCSGGRYANLTQSLDPKSQRYDGVGGSIGFSRVMTLILESAAGQQAVAARKTSVDYLVIHFPETFADALTIAKSLQRDGKIVDIYPSPDKLKKQFSYADKHGIPNVVVYGEGERDAGIYKVKDMTTGDEQSV